LATASPNRFHGLVERLVYSRRSSPHAVFDIAPFHSRAVRALAEVDLPSPRKADSVWLERVELRGPRRVINFLESQGFPPHSRSISALFVDSRCGLIRSDLLGTSAKFDPNRMVADILRRGSSCHASAIILASHDPVGSLASGARLRRLTIELYRKGEAAEIFLLDHFVLTTNGWKRLFSSRPDEAVRAGLAA
jgi:DNA repair protein RadC